MANTSESLQGLRVLVVEDEGLIAMELGERLSRMGMRVVATADTADLAVASASQMRPDIVLMDIRIKGNRDGVQAAGDISRTLDVPIVYLTAHSDRATLDRAKSTAPYGYVLKPFQERELLVAIEMAVHRHALERTLKESERKYVATLASIGDGVVATDLKGCITFMNPVAEALTGWVFADARGLHADKVLQVAVDARGATMVSPITRALLENKVIRFDEAELFLFSKNNEAIPIDDCAAPILDEHDRVIGGVVAFRDIRDRRLTEDALRRAQEELYQSQKMESVGRLAAGIAHDFNNLLTVINGCGELALSGENLDDTTRDLLQDVVSAGGRAAVLTRQFLALGRKQTLSPRTLDLTALVTDLAAMLRRLIGEDVILTTASPAEPDVLVLTVADPGQIEQVIVNLVVNARDAMPDGGAITIATGHTTIETDSLKAREVEPGRYAVLSVTDSGQGIDETAKSQIFEPYFTTKEFGKGLGLGLATVYGIVKQSDGFIELDSAPGRGTTFTIYLPLVADVASRVELLPGSISPLIVERGSESILLVEDEEAVRSLVSNVLRRKGYTVIEAADGESALLAFEQHSGSIDLVITDVVMPGMRGPALVERLSGLQNRFRVLYMSGYSDVVGITPGAAFIQKPFTPAALARKAREVLDS